MHQISVVFSFTLGIVTPPRPASAPPSNYGLGLLALASSSLLLFHLLGHRHGVGHLAGRRLPAAGRGHRLGELGEDDVGRLEGALAAGGHDGRAGPGAAPARRDGRPDLVLHRLDAEVQARVQGEVLEVVSE